MLSRAPPNFHLMLGTCSVCGNRSTGTRETTHSPGLPTSGGLHTHCSVRRSRWLSFGHSMGSGLIGSGLIGSGLTITPAVSSLQLVIQNSLFDSTWGYGVNLQSSACIHGCTISNCTFSNTGFNGVYISNNWQQFQNPASPIPTIVKSTFFYNGRTTGRPGLG